MQCIQAHTVSIVDVVGVYILKVNIFLMFLCNRRGITELLSLHFWGLILLLFVERPYFINVVDLKRSVRFLNVL